MIVHVHSIITSNDADDADDDDGLMVIVTIMLTVQIMAIFIYHQSHLYLPVRGEDKSTALNQDRTRKSAKN